MAGERTAANASVPSLPNKSIKILPRSSWKAARIGSDTDPMSSPKRITVHHEGKEFLGTTLEDTLTQVNNIQQWHQRGRKWADIGYHFLIDRLGNIVEGRPLTLQGAHAGERNKRGETPNAGNIGISLLGDFDKQRITPAQEKSLRQLIAYLEQTYGISNSEVYTHNEIRLKYNIGATGCPGKNLAPVIQDIRRRGPLSVATSGASKPQLSD
jgi:N-acetyl-anhydromuramyl-L-alanine amidase AmpD